MKKVIAILFVSLLTSGAAFAEVGPNKSANCKDIIEGIKKKQQQAAAQGAQQPAANGANSGNQSAQ